MVSEERKNQIRLVCRTAALVCRLGSVLLFPPEAVSRILESMVVTRYQIVLPALVVRQPIVHAGKSLDYLFLVAGVGFNRV